eukprot:gene1340-32698_t
MVWQGGGADSWTPQGGEGGPDFQFKAVDVVFKGDKRGALCVKTEIKVMMTIKVGLQGVAIGGCKGGQIPGLPRGEGGPDFQFKAVDVVFKGDKIWEVTPKTKPKTYTFFYVGDKMAAARSSSGGVALLIKF